jgi:hypothetical protein
MIAPNVLAVKPLDIGVGRSGPTKARSSDDGGSVSEQGRSRIDGHTRGTQDGGGPPEFTRRSNS